MATDDELVAAAEQLVDSLLGMFRPALVDAFAQMARNLFEPLPTRTLREIRTDYGLTLKEVAARSGLSVSHISEIERNLTAPSTDALQKLAAVYGQKVSFALTNVEAPQ